MLLRQLGIPLDAGHAAARHAALARSAIGPYARRIVDRPQSKFLSCDAGSLQTIDCRTVIDGLRVRRAGELNFSVGQRYVDDIVTLRDKDIFEAMLWVMERCKLVVEGAAAAPVAALLHGLVKLPTGSRVAAVISGGNLPLDQLRELRWN